MRSIASIEARKNKVLSTHMRNKSGHVNATRNGTANVFAKCLQTSLLN